MKQNNAFIGIRVPQELADRLTAHCKKTQRNSSEVIRRLLEALLLTPDERLATLKEAEDEFNKGVDELKQRMDRKIESISTTLPVHEAGEKPGAWVSKGHKAK